MVHRVHRIHAALLAHGFESTKNAEGKWEGPKLGRQDFEQLLVTCDPSLTSRKLKEYLDEGRVRGLWILLAGGPSKGALRVLRPKQREPLADEAEPTRAEA